jgi:hypothetical protein
VGPAAVLLLTLAAADPALGSARRVETPTLEVALVAEDPATLRNAPRTDAPAQATLWRGDWLEVRGERAGFLQVYDHRHERPGYIRPTQVRVYRLEAASAPDLEAIVRFLRDASGSESLGIGYAALALKVAPAGADASALLASIGTMADRLARRISARRADAKDATLVAQREVVESYGVKFKVVEGDALGGRGSTCYDGEAWEGVLAAPSAAPVERARAALFLAADRCRDAVPNPAPVEERAGNDRRIGALQAIDFPATNALPASLAGRIRLRRAEAFAWRAFDEARQGNADAAARAESTAVRELALCDRGLLAQDDLDLYEEVAVKVAASRWATEAAPRDAGRRAIAVDFSTRAPGETCVRIYQTNVHDPRVLAQRCSYGIVWKSALRWAPSGTVATLAVQPLAAWTELWVLRRADDGGWTIDTLTPATADPDATPGYVESAGFSPDGKRLLVVREARAGGHATRKFQVLATSTLAVERWAASADKLGAFKRWSAPSWRAGTLVLR